jgi:hypothetical protein
MTSDAVRRGKCSPIHLFWGAQDLTLTRFSGRTAPRHPGGIPNLPDWVTREAYSHEVSSCGFWPGGGPVPYPAFYSYAYPEPPGYASAAIRPREAFYSPDLREFILPYDAVRQSPAPGERLLDFLQATDEAAADFGHGTGPRSSAAFLPPVQRIEHFHSLRGVQLIAAGERLRLYEYVFPRGDHRREPCPITNTSSLAAGWQRMPRSAGSARWTAMARSV